MKLSEWIAELQADLDHCGDKELLDMPGPWLSDVIPAELARWLLLNDWVVVTLLPEGLFCPGVLDEDLDDDEFEAISVSLDDVAAQYAGMENERVTFAATLRRALAIVEDSGNTDSSLVVGPESPGEKKVYDFLDLVNMPKNVESLGFGIRDGSEYWNGEVKQK